MGYVSVAFHTPSFIEVDIAPELEVLPIPERDLDRSQGLLEHFHAFVFLLDREFEHDSIMNLILNLEFHAFIASIATDEVGCDIDGGRNGALDVEVPCLPFQIFSFISGSHVKGLTETPWIDEITWVIDGLLASDEILPGHREGLGLPGFNHLSALDLELLERSLDSGLGLDHQGTGLSASTITCVTSLLG